MKKYLVCAGKSAVFIFPASKPTGSSTGPVSCPHTNH